MSNMIQLAAFKDGNTYCLFNRNEIEDFTPEMLTAEYWQENNAITGSAQGRGTTWFIQYQSSIQDKQWVLRHYYRGGLIGKIVNDSYFFTALKHTRADREFSLLAHMQTLALPAPKPIAYRVIRQGLLYRADLLSSRIENAQDLVAILTQKVISDDLWFNIGETIRRFHSQGIYHHDLNAHNILIDNNNNKAWLIDFDQGELRAVSTRWQQNNMQRLLRSFRKEQKKLSNFYWQESHWDALLAGYNQ
ncbi:3-deoxy-D-manno-octulosonic acid kinase [Colwellia sp. 6_MG-2023]|uniref:3-deoxy-D-manno-octulosonic acid kinase n=1 Tax=Colwellia sp. 6_MG-2023 TaxID=3062676 RepID=UPI0026E3F2BC|nr:3-deoxy-D-manno-octulosonic acid kinase [Colwellia sp. 6_MG-2023]MDO6486278.1 3-deoxy-D-manno-octulosonic acid kinase [Colwellia sp. 6_MG-2023]